MTRYSRPPGTRLKTPAEFQRVYDVKQRFGDGHLLVFGAANDGGPTRIGCSVSKKHGGAVVRNRIKRLLREAFRLIRADLPTGLDLVLIPRQGANSSLDDYRRSLRTAAEKLARRIVRASQPPGDRP